MSYQTTAVLLGIAIGLSGCATQHYRPKPISPQAQAAALEARSLNSADLQRFVETNITPRPDSWPPKKWDPGMLTLAALYFHPDLNVSRSGVKVAEAAIVTAGARPNPTIDITPGGSTSIESPWLFGATFNLPIVTAGKRGYQIAVAQHRAEAARLDLAETAWQVRARLRSALLNLLITQQDIDLLHKEEQVRGEMVRLIARRVSAGELPSPELNSPWCM
jgi:outer membrane protein TolC